MFAYGNQVKKLHCAASPAKNHCDVLFENNLPKGISTLLNGESSVGKWLAEDHRVALVSATGSTRMGKDVAQRVAAQV